jgi:predicted nucleic acid-binding protein
VEDEVRVFLDTSALFAAVYSETGGARLILKLGEAGALQIWIGPWVLQEADRVIEQKSPTSKPTFALLLDRARVRVGKEASTEAQEQALAVVEYRPDAQIIAEALTVGVDYLVSFDRAHLVGNPRLTALPFPVGTAGDCLAWYRTRLAERGGSFPL